MPRGRTRQAEDPKVFTTTSSRGAVITLERYAVQLSRGDTTGPHEYGSSNFGAFRPISARRASSSSRACPPPIPVAPTAAAPSRHLLSEESVEEIVQHVSAALHAVFVDVLKSVEHQYECKLHRLYHVMRDKGAAAEAFDYRCCAALVADTERTEYEPQSITTAGATDLLLGASSSAPSTKASHALLRLERQFARLSTKHNASFQRIDRAVQEASARLRSSMSALKHAESTEDQRRGETSTDPILDRVPGSSRPHARLDQPTSTEVSPAASWLFGDIDAQLDSLSQRAHKLLLGATSDDNRAPRASITTPSLGQSEMGTPSDVQLKEEDHASDVHIQQLRPITRHISVASQCDILRPKTTDDSERRPLVADSDHLSQFGVIIGDNPVVGRSLESTRNPSSRASKVPQLSPPADAPLLRADGVDSTMHFVTEPQIETQPSVPFRDALTQTRSTTPRAIGRPHSRHSPSDTASLLTAEAVKKRAPHPPQRSAATGSPHQPRSTPPHGPQHDGAVRRRPSRISKESADAEVNTCSTEPTVDLLRSQAAEALHQHTRKIAAAFATAARALEAYTSGLENDIMCRCCFRVLVQPSVLWPCGHSFCRECIEKEMSAVDSDTQDRYYTCRECGSRSVEGHAVDSTLSAIVSKWTFKRCTVGEPAAIVASLRDALARNNVHLPTTR